MKTPSTFFHSVTSTDLNSAAKMVAEKSEPERFNVVGVPSAVLAFRMR